MQLKRVTWDGTPAEGDEPLPLPPSVTHHVFDFLPEPVPITAKIEELAARYLQTGSFELHEYRALQAAAFLMPKTPEVHTNRRSRFRQRVAEAQAAGFVVPEAFCTLVETDAYVDRLHHNLIWLKAPEELVPLPCDASRLIFLAFVEGHAGCGWHLLLNLDGSHSVVYCDDAFGLPSAWPSPPDYDKFEVQLCADSIEDWLYHYFLDCAEYNHTSLDLLNDYFGG